ncbi:hypothetical protein [Alicyclobacillus fodiniaquatilis]
MRNVHDGKRKTKVTDPIDESINELIDKQIEQKVELDINMSMGKQERNNVVSVRLTDDGVSCLDDLIFAKIAKSRSEAAAFLITEGINANAALFTQTKKYTQQINEAKKMLQETVRINRSVQSTER